MFNNLLKKASESSFAAMASEAMDNSRPGSPAMRRPPGSPGGPQNGANSPVRKPIRNRPPGTQGPNALSSNAQLAAQLDEAYSDIESFQKLLQNAAAEKSEMIKGVEELRGEKESLSDELKEAQVLIESMRATLESRATDEFLSPKLGASDTNGHALLENATAVSGLQDPLGVSPVCDDDMEGPKEESPAKAKAIVQASPQVQDNAGFENTIKELRQKLATRDEQYRELDGSFAQRTSELAKQKSDHDEKMKKMKAIFAAANKNLNEYRQSIAAKDEEIAECKAKLENHQPSAEVAEEQSRIVSDLEAELKNQSEQATIKFQQMETKYRQTNGQLEKLKEEYQQYKQRASALLQQQRESVQADDDSKLGDLQRQLEALTKENRTVAEELQEAESKKAALENELQLALDQIATLESSKEISRRQERQLVRHTKDLERSLKDAQREREAAEAKVASLQELREVEAQSLMAELGGNTKHIEDRLAKKEEENAELHRILDRSSDDLAAAKQEIQNLRDLLSAAEATTNGDMSSNAASTLLSPNHEQDGKSQGQLFISTATGPRSSISPHETESPISRASSSMSLPMDRPPIYSTLSDLLGAKPLVERSPFMEPTSIMERTSFAVPNLVPAKEKEYQIKLQQLTDLLNESEANHQRLLDQEKVLKEEIRNLDRAERRQNLSVDYLKNIVLKYLETSDREQLLPVLTTVLQLSPAEVASLRKKTVQTSASSLVLGGLFGGGGGSGGQR